MTAGQTSFFPDESTLRKRRPSMQQKLEEAISNVWDSLTAIEIKNYFTHYLNRLDVCTRNGGSRTKYKIYG